jgi:hypothetical protein
MFDLRSPRVGVSGGPGWTLGAQQACLSAERRVQPLSHAVSRPLHAAAATCTALAGGRRQRTARSRRCSRVAACVVRRRLPTTHLPFLRLLLLARYGDSSACKSRVPVAERRRVLQLLVCDAAAQLSAAARVLAATKARA